MTDLATTWHDAMRTAATLNPAKIAPLILAEADNGLRAQRFDSIGGRTSFAPCDDPNCFDGNPEYAPHSHQVASDPTGNAAVNQRRTDDGMDELRALNRAGNAFIDHAFAVLEFVSEYRPTTWTAVLQANARIMPGTVQAGLDVDHERFLPFHINGAAKAVQDVKRIAVGYQTREPSQDEQHWTAGLGDNDVCQWHLAIHRRYRRPKVVIYKGEPICSDCFTLVDLGDTKPPAKLIEAEIDRLAQPRAWQRALGEWLDELGVARSA